MGIPASGEWYENAVRNGLIPTEAVVAAIGKMSEAAFQFSVIERARENGWRCAHFRKVRVQRKNGEVYWETPVAADGTGFPDLILIRGHDMIAAELKVGKNKTTPEQERWLEAFAGVFGRVEAIVWYPTDWPAIVQRLASPPPSSR